MKKITLIGILLLYLMSGIITASTVEVEEVSHDEVVRTVEQLNTIRSMYDLEAIKVNETLNLMAQMHSNYMKANSSLSNIEENELMYFRGRYPWDRASYYKYPLEVVYEFNKKNMSTYFAGVSSILNDPVGRSVFLNPMYTEIGMGKKDEYMTFDLGGDTLLKDMYVTYPGNGQENIPIVWKGENYALYYGEMEELPENTGLPITVTYYGGGINHLRNVEVTITDLLTDEVVPAITMLPGDYYQLKATLTVLPTKAYHYGRRYEVHVKFTAAMNDGTTDYYENTTIFRTITANNYTVASTFITRASFVEALVKNSVFKLPIIEPLEYKFKDVDINTPSSVYIYSASAAGIISGYPDKQFKPTLNITREQAYIILIKTYEESYDPIVVEAGPLSYVDSDQISVWALEYVKKADMLGLVLEDENKISPKAYVNEDEMNVLIKRLQQLYVD